MENNKKRFAPLILLMTVVFALVSAYMVYNLFQDNGNDDILNIFKQDEFDLENTNFDFSTLHNDEDITQYEQDDLQEVKDIQETENENIFVMDNGRAMTQDIRPLEIAILNLILLNILLGK